MHNRIIIAQNKLKVQANSKIEQFILNIPQNV